MYEEVVQTKTGTATAAPVDLNPVSDIGYPVLAVDYPGYVTKQNEPSFSFFEKTSTFPKPENTHEFAKDIASVFASLSEGQEPLGSEFEAVWDANLAELYES